MPGVCSAIFMWMAFYALLFRGLYDAASWLFSSFIFGILAVLFFRDETKN